MGNKSYTTYEKLTAKELFKLMPFLEDGVVPNVFTFRNVRNVLQLGEYSETDFVTALEDDIKQNIDMLKKITNLVLENNIETPSIKKGFGDTIEINFECGSRIVKNNWSEVFYENFYEELKSKSGSNLVNFAKEAKDFKTGYGLIKKEVRNDVSINRYLLENLQEKTKNDLENIFAEYFENPLTINLKSKEKFVEKVNPKVIATIYEDAQHTVIFPLNEETKEKYSKDVEKYRVYLELDSLMTTKENKYFNKIEVDLGESSGDDNKNGAVEKVIETFHIVNSQNLTLATKFDFRIRKFGKHDSKYRILNGVYMPANPEVKNHTIAVKTGSGGAGAVMHEIGHLIDLTQFENTEMRHLVVQHFSSKLSFEGIRRVDINYYTKPTEVIARLIELGHDLKYPETKTDTIRLVSSREYYEENSNIYFGYKDWTDEDKELATSVYDIFCENKLAKDLKEEKLKELSFKLKTSRQKAMEEDKRTRQKFTREQLEDMELRKITRNYDSDMVKYVLETTGAKEESGEYLEFRQVDNIKLFLHLLSLNLLNPHNRKSQKFDMATVRGQVTINLENFKVLIAAFGKLSTEDKLDILNGQDTINEFKAVIKLGMLRGWTGVTKLREEVSSIISEIGDYDQKSDYGFWNVMRSEEVVKLVNEDAKLTATSLNNITSSIKKEQRMKNIIRLLDEATKKGLNYQVNLTKEAVRGYIFELMENYSVHTVSSHARNNEAVYGLTQVHYDIRSANRSGEAATQKQREDFFNIRYEVFEKSLNKKGPIVQKELILDDYDFNLPDIIKNKSVIKTLMNNRGNDEVGVLIENLKMGSNPVEVKTILGDFLTETERKELDRKKEYMIQKVVPKLSTRLEKLSKESILADMVKHTGLKGVDIENVFRVRVILEVVDKVGIMLDKLSHLERLKNEIGADTTIMFDSDEFEDNVIYADANDEEFGKIKSEIGSFEIVLGEVEEDLMTEGLSELEIKELQSVKEDILSQQELHSKYEDELNEAIKVGNLNKIASIYRDQITNVLGLVLGNNKEKEKEKPAKYTQTSFDFK